MAFSPILVWSFDPAARAPLTRPYPVCASARSVVLLMPAMYRHGTYIEGSFERLRQVIRRREGRLDDGVGRRTQ